jgi:hypothetical protein
MVVFNYTNVVAIHSSQSLSMLFEETECVSDILLLILRIQPIFLFIFGFVANLCSFAVLIQPRLRRRPTFSYLAFLSLSNALLSLIHASFTITGVYFGKTLENLPLFLFCRLLNRFSIDFLTHFSLYTLTAVDLDRVGTVTAKTNAQQRYSRGPNTRPNGCSKAFIRVCLIEFSFAFVLFFINLHWLTSYGYIESTPGSNDRTMCIIDNKQGDSSAYALYLRAILPYIELVLFGIIPFLISLIATIIIIRHVSVKYAFINSHNKHLKQSRRRLELHLSILLIFLNCVFIVFTTPHNVYHIYLGRLHRQLDNKDESEGELCPIAVTQKSLDLLQQCYFMSTFFLYILTNKRFREEFYRVFRCFIFNLCRKPITNSSPIPVIINRHHLGDTNHTHETYLMAPSRDLLGSRTSLSDAWQDDELIPSVNNS